MSFFVDYLIGLGVIFVTEKERFYGDLFKIEIFEVDIVEFSMLWFKKSGLLLTELFMRFF